MKDSREWRGIEREGCSFVFVLPPISEHVKEYDQSFFKEFLDMLSQNSGKKLALARERRREAVHFDKCLQNCIKALSLKFRKRKRKSLS